MKKTAFLFSVLFCSTQAFAQTPEYLNLLERYLVAAEGSAVLPKVRALNAVVSHVFAEPFSDSYRVNLRHLDSIRAAYPRAVLDLAVALQQRWEADYLASVYDFRAQALDHRETDEKMGYIIGLAALTATVLSRRVDRLPQYFLLFRGFLPYAGLRLYRTESPMAPSAVPPAPAHLLRLGLPQSAEQIAERLAREQSIRNLEILAASITLGTVAADLTQLLFYARVAAAASTVTRLHPVALVVGVVVSIAVIEGLEYAIERSETERQENNFRIAARNLQTAARQGNPNEIYARAQRLATRALELAAYRNQALWQASREAAQAGGTDASIRELGRTAQSTWEAQVRADQSEEAGYLARTLLRAGLTSTDLRTAPNLHILASAHERRFERWIASHGTSVDREAAWRQFLQGADRAQSRALAERFQMGTVAQHPSLILWQATALIESLEQGFLENTANMLRSKIALGQSLVSMLSAHGEARP